MAARDQLWAEAVHRFKADEARIRAGQLRIWPWWLETDELEALARHEQERRFIVDAWEKPSANG